MQLPIRVPRIAAAILAATPITVSVGWLRTTANSKVVTQFRLELQSSRRYSKDSSSTCALAKIIQNGKLTHSEIAGKAGTSRTRVTAIANGNTQGLSTDLLIRVLFATGYKAELRVRRTAA